MGQMSLAVGALSYAGQFDIMATADGDAYPDLDVFAAAARSELEELADATGLRKPDAQIRSK